MRQYRELDETVRQEARRLQSYIDALLRREDAHAGGESEETQHYICQEPEGMDLVVREGDAVSFIHFAGNGNMVAGCYKREAGAVSSRPSLVKRHIDRFGIKFDGVRYATPELMMRCGEDVQVVRFGNVLHVFDMRGRGIVDIQCD